jgi:hypothetical protein
MEEDELEAARVRAAAERRDHGMVSNTFVWVC